MGLTGIDPTAYITDVDPTSATAQDISLWFKLENQSGISDANIAWMIAQGWTITNSNTDDNGDITHSVERRQVDPEKILSALVSDYITAYNEGRILNDSRYDEIVTLYSLMQTTSQIDWQSRDAGNTNAETIILALADAMDADYTAYAVAADGLLDDIDAAQILQINARFDNELTRQAQDLTSRGMYNSTVWASVSVGIERERTLALTDLSGKTAVQQVNLLHTLNAAKSTMRSKVISAVERLWIQIGASSDARLAARNAVMTALLTFMERRTDSYPDLDAIGKLATALGAGNAAGFTP